MTYDLYEDAFEDEGFEEDINEFAEEIATDQEEYDAYSEDYDDFEDDYSEDYDAFEDEFFDEFDAITEASPWDNEAEDEFVGALAGMATKALPRIASKVVPRVAKWGRQLWRTTAPARRHIIKKAPKILAGATRAMLRQQKTISKKPRTASRILKKYTRPYLRRYGYPGRVGPYARRRIGVRPPIPQGYSPSYRTPPPVGQRSYYPPRFAVGRRSYGRPMPLPRYRRRRYLADGRYQRPGQFYQPFPRRRFRIYRGYGPYPDYYPYPDYTDYPGYEPNPYDDMSYRRPMAPEWA